MERKKQFRWFSVYDYEKEQDYLRDMHKSGWKFVEVKFLGTYYFEKCTPQDVVYQLDYNQNGLAHKDEYVRMFEDCGWEYIKDFAGYSYFRKAVTDDGVAEEIFCDDDSRLQMMRRVLKGRMLPLLCIFLTSVLPLFLYSLLSHHYFRVAFTGGVLAVYIAAFTWFFVKYIQYKNRKK